MNAARHNPRPAARHRSAACFALLATLFLCHTVALGWQIRLRNDLTPGSRAVYDVAIRGVRTTHTIHYEEVLTYAQTGRLTLVILERPVQGVAVRAWMMELDEPAIESMTRDGQPVADFPPAKTVGLPPRLVQLTTGQVTPERAQASAVGGSWVQRAAMLLALDFAQWPDELVDEGASWERPAERDELRGTWTHQYTGTEGERGERLAIGAFNFAGKLTGRFEGVADIEKVSGQWKWYVAKRSLYSSASDVSLSYGDPEDPRLIDMHVELKLAARDHLDADQRKAALAELNQLGKLAVAANESDDNGEEELAEFIEAHPRSIWRPVAEDLLARAAYDERVFGDLDADELVGALTKLVTAWQRAALSNQVEPLEPIRATLRELTESNRSTLYGLLKADDPNVRAMAAFCIAFGRELGDLAKVTDLCRDTSNRVRAWAAYGLAERRDPATDRDVLATLLADEDSNVRQRACMAVEACITIDAPQRERFFDLLLELVNTDPVDEVRPRAASALVSLAKKSDLPALIDAEHQQDVPPARRVLEAKIRELGGEPKGLDDE